jgi:dienelactone hydrolase
MHVSRAANAPSTQACPQHVRDPAAMRTGTEIEYQADGRTMIGRLAVPDSEDQRPAVLIAHEGPGLDDHQRHRADQLAELGYIAFALDYQGGGMSMTDRDAMMARLDELWHDPEPPAGWPARA